MGTGYKAASSSFPACATRENTCVLSQPVLTGFAFGLGSYVRLLTCISSPSLVRWERMSHNSSHSKMCATPARATTTARRWQKTAWRRKRRSFLSACRQPDRPIVCRWSLAAVSLWAAGQRNRQPWGKGTGGGWPRALLSGPRFSLSLLLLEGTGG